MRWGRGRPFTTHLGAVILLVVVLGVAALGAADEPATGHAIEAGDASTLTGPRGAGDPGDASGATSSGIPMADLQAGSDLNDGPARRPDGATNGGRTGTAARLYDQGVTDTEIRIGGSTFTSGPAAVYGEQIAVGFAAGVNYINATGGINGRRVALKIYDDGGDPAKQLANVRRLVEVDKVFALSMAYAPIAGPYVAEKGIPVFHLGQHDDEFFNPWYFPVGGPQRLASYAMANFGVRTLGVRRVAVFYLDAGAANYSRAFAETVARDWRAYGVDVPVLVPFAPDQTSCSDAIGKARDAGVEFIQFEIDASKVINCGVEAQIQNYKPPKGWGGYLIGVPVIHEALGDFSAGMYAFDAFGANYDVPAYVDAVKKVSARTEPYSSVTASYFISALLMRDAIAALGDRITRSGVRDVINNLTDWTPGLTRHPNQPRWTWRENCHVALRGGYVIQVQRVDGKLRWQQITPQSEYTPLPPDARPPAAFRDCDIFGPG